MKQLKILGVLAVALTLGLAACNGGGDKSADASTPAGKHVHEALPDAPWDGNDNNHWKNCKDNDGGKVNNEKHTFGDPYDVVPAKCEVPGSQKVKCTVCNKEVTQTIKALEHEWEAVPQADDPDYIAPDFGVPGQHTEKCKLCQKTRKVEDAALQRGFTISNASYTKKDDGKVYLVLSGTCSDYTQENFKWAYALQDYNNGQAGGKFLAGKEEPADEDFNLSVTLVPGEGDADDTFTVEFNLTDIAVPDGIDKPGRYNLWAGPKDNYKTINVSLTPGNYADNAHRYYFRNDQEVGSRLTVCIEELPPFFHFTDAVASFKGAGTDEDPKVAWVRIYGEALDQTKSVAELEADLAATHTACRFQSQSNSFTTRNAEGEFEMKVTEEGGKKIVSVWVNVQFMVDGSNTVYNTHLNLKAGAEINAWRDYTNCVMEEDFEHVLAISETRELVVFSHPLGENNVENSYGNLGFRTRDVQAAAQD